MKLPSLTKNASFVSFATIGAAIVLIIAGLVYFTQQERQREAINQQIAKTNELIEEVKELANQNKAINEQNRDYAYCIAVLLAKYTQNDTPIVIEDLESCTTSSFVEDYENTPIMSNDVPSRERSTNTQNRAPEAATRPNQPTPRVSVIPSAPDNNRSDDTPSPSVNVPGVLEFNLPCVSALGLLNTCSL